MIFDSHARAALVVATLTLGASAIGFNFAVRAARYHLQKEPVPLRAPLTTIPRTLGEWEAQGADQRLTAEVEEELGTEDYLDRRYVKKGADPALGTLMVHITYYTGLIDTVPHIPDRCLVAGGWVKQGTPENLALDVDSSHWQVDPGPANLRTRHPYWMYTYRHRITGRPVTVRMPLGEFFLRSNEFSINQEPDLRVHAGYFFIANGETTPHPDKVRTFAFDLTTRYAYYAKIQFTMPTRSEVGKEQFTAAVEDLLAELLPEVMSCLPDWSEVEKKSDVALSRAGTTPGGVEDGQRRSDEG